jgi:hypothetical protein
MGTRRGHSSVGGMDRGSVGYYCVGNSASGDGQLV